MPGKSSNILNNVVFFFFLLFLFSSTFSIALSQFSLGVSLAAFIVLIATTHYNPFAKNLLPVYFAVGLYLVWMVITSLVSATPMKSFIMLKEEWLFCIIPIGIYLFRQRQYRHILLLALAAGVILISIYSVIQHYTGVNWFKDYTPVQTPDGTFYAIGAFHHNLTFGNYLALASMFLISAAIIRGKQALKLPHLMMLISGIMGIIGTVMSYSRMAVAALPIALVVLSWLKGKRWALISSVSIVVLAALTFMFVSELARKYEQAFKRDLVGENESSRPFIWKKSWAIATDNPLFGVGQGNFESTYSAYLDAKRNETKARPHAHNDILNYAAIAGIPGAVIFLHLWMTVFYKLHRIWHNSEHGSDKKIFAGASAIGCLAFFLTSLTEATFADEEVRQLLMAIWAAGLWPLCTDKNQQPTETAESS